MTRGIGVVPVVQDALPDWSAVVFGLATQLGDPWFLVLTLVVLYWRLPTARRDTVLVAAMYLTGVGFYRSIKLLTAVPRPDRPLLDPAAAPELLRPLYEATAFSGGYGFPSGHATGSAVVFFGLAAVLPVSSRRRRYGVAAALVALIGFTRLALGLHYLVDVLAGFALGGAVVLFALRGFGTRDRLAGTLAVAAAASLFYVVLSGGEPKALLSAGAVFGLLAARSLGFVPSQ